MVRSSWILSLLLALALGASSASPARSIPSPPEERADRFGVYYWGADLSTWTGTPNHLAWGADKVAAIGTRTIRVFLGPSDPYQVNPKTNPPGDLFLKRIAASPAYDALFRDPRFRTYLLTVSTATAEPTAAAVRSQIARLGEHLLATYEGKTFILLNWEGDNSVGAEPPGSPEWDELVARTQARADGVVDARARQSDSSSRLYSGLEFNLVARDGVRCGDGTVRCVIDSVAPRVSVDYYSYSGWQSLDGKRVNPSASLAKILRDDLGFALRKVRSRRPKIQEENFILGEWGFARSIYSECLAARYLAEVVRALEAPNGFHVSYAVYWQTLDNGWRGGRRTPCVGNLRDEGDPEGQVDWMLYGLFRGRNGKMTLPGATLQALLHNDPVPPLPRCPAIDAGGVAGASEDGPFLHPDGPLTISGLGFGQRGGNKIVILQAHDRQGSAPNVLRELGPQSDPRWDESPQRINATVPEGVFHDGCALVWVTSGNGVESNAVLVRIEPDGTKD
jgi:hypothetical protein